MASSDAAVSWAAGVSEAGSAVAVVGLENGKNFGVGLGSITGAMAAAFGHLVSPWDPRDSWFTSVPLRGPVVPRFPIYSCTFSPILPPQINFGHF